MLCSDVKFLVGHNKKSIFAHKYILAARCEVFRAMFTDRAGGAGVERTALPGGREAAGTLPAGLGTSLRSDDAPIVIDRLTPDVFLAMLEFIYSNCVTLNSRIVRCFCLQQAPFALPYSYSSLLYSCTPHTYYLTCSYARRRCRYSAAPTSTASRSSRRCATACSLRM